MYYRHGAIAAAALSLAMLAPTGFAIAADLPVKAKAPPADLPFFFVIDNRVTYSWMPKGTDPGMYTIQPNGSINGTTAKSVYSFTHFDAWAYGTNFFNGQSEVTGNILNELTRSRGTLSRHFVIQYFSQFVYFDCPDIERSHIDNGHGTRT